ELGGAPYYLRRVKQEIEENCKRLQPALTQARQSLAQAEKDLEVAAKPNPLWMVIAVLILTFCIASFLESYTNSDHLLPVRVEIAAPDVIPFKRPPGQASSLEVTEFEEANELYNQGMLLARQGKYSEAESSFRKAVKIRPTFTEAHDQLIDILYRLQRYDESIAAAKAAIRYTEYYTPYYYLGMNYIAKENWDKAKTAFDSALTYQDRASWDKKYLDAYYNRGLVLSRLGKAQERIKILEKNLRRVPGETIERAELATLYLCVGSIEAAEIQYQILDREDSAIAEEFRTLMFKHNILKGSK